MPTQGPRPLSDDLVRAHVKAARARQKQAKRHNLIAWAIVCAALAVLVWLVQP